VSFILEGIMYVWQGANNVHFPDLLPDTRFPLFGASLAVKDIIVIVSALVLVVLLNVFINGTKLGKAMRATAQDREAAQLMGININRTIAATFFIGAALAAAGGIIFGLYFNNIRFDEGFIAGLFAFTAAVFGGIGNIQGAALGGLFIGLVQAFSNSYRRGVYRRFVRVHGGGLRRHRQHPGRRPGRALHRAGAGVLQLVLPGGIDGCLDLRHFDPGARLSARRTARHAGT